jgi:hypothetical protein
MTRTAGFILLVLALPAFAQHADVRETTVGMAGRFEGVVLPGPELEAKPYTDRKTPVVLRVVHVYPHGTAFRYDLEYFGLEPGTYNLRDYLRRKNGQPSTNLPPLSVKVAPLLPPGQVRPNKLEIETGPRVGGYWLILTVLGVLWLVGLAGIIFSFFLPMLRNRGRAAVVGRPVSLADRLRPLVEGAIAGKLSHTELASLERTLLAFWRKRLKLEAAEPGAAIAALRDHPDAGPLLAQLEAWLHRPGTPEAVDVGKLLDPYRDLPPDAVDLASGTRQGAEYAANSDQ